MGEARDAVGAIAGHHWVSNPHTVLKKSAETRNTTPLGAVGLILSRSYSDATRTRCEVHPPRARRAGGIERNPT